MTYALIPAAGESRRMGRPKLSLPLHGRTVLECVITALRQASIEHIVVVVSPAGPDLAALAERAGASVCTLEEQTPDMRATIERGLDWLEAHFQPAADTRWLLVPGDHPTLDAAVVRQLLQSGEAIPERSIVVPVYQGKRGHPTIMAWKHVRAIKELPRGLGLNAYVRSQAEEVREVPVRSPSILVDLDTPEDYERLCRTDEQP
jgi:molybdenum cofactor cytidylyltransferase